MPLTRCQGEFLHSSSCVGSVPLVCRSRSIPIGWAREDLSDQELPIIGAALSAWKSLPCAGNAHERRGYFAILALGRSGLVHSMSALPHKGGAKRNVRREPQADS